MTRSQRRDVRNWGGVAAMLLLVCFLVNGLVYAFMVRPKVQSVWELKNNSGPQIEALEERTDLVERMESYVGGLKQAETDMSTLRQDVLSTRERRFVDVQAEIADLSRQFNIPIDRVSYNHEILESEELDVAKITVPLEGSYSDLRRFLQAAEASDKFLVVERVSLGTSSTGAGKLQLSIGMSTYFNAPKELLDSLRSLRRTGGA